MSERARRIVVLLAALAGVALTARLGVWQLDRGAQKQALGDAIAARAKSTPLDAAALAREPAAAESQFWRPIRLRGRWLADHTVFLDNRQMNGRPGFFVVTPLQLAPGDAVLVQRGWVPRDLEQRTRLPAIPTPAGEVEVQGRIAPPPSRLFSFAPDAPGTIRQNLDLDAFALEVGTRLRPLSVQQLQADAPDGLQRDWPQPTVDVAKHHGYAFQWFAMATLIAGLYVWFQLLRPRLARQRAA
jgi:surfeit locus 1 family protein